MIMLLEREGKEMKLGAYLYNDTAELIIREFKSRTGEYDSVQYVAVCCCILRLCSLPRLR